MTINLSSRMAIITGAGGSFDKSRHEPARAGYAPAPGKAAAHG